jgi:hypothetical protein
MEAKRYKADDKTNQQPPQIWIAWSFYTIGVIIICPAASSIRLIKSYISKLQHERNTSCPLLFLTRSFRWDVLRLQHKKVAVLTTGIL